MIDIETRLAEIEKVFIGDGKHFSEFDKALAVHVANHLSGREVEVWFQEPETDNAIGMACKNGDKANIQIRPGLERERALSTLVHEAAHIKLHWDHLPYLAVVRIKNRTGMKANYSDEYLKAWNQREREAEAQERYWLYYAGERGKTVTEKLVALLSWPGA